MKICRSFFLIIRLLTVAHLIATSVRAEPVTYVVEDHLVPRNPEIDGALRSVLEEKLFLTPADCALLLIRPAVKGESAVSVYSRGHQDLEETFYVTLTEAERNMDMAMAIAGGEVEQVNKIRVRRCDAQIPKPTAIALRSAWKAMLDQTKKPGIYARPTLDREEFEFSIIRPNSKPRYATLPNKAGKNVGALVRLGRQLAGYCNAPATRQRALAKQIERDAKLLVGALTSRR
jgi:hypothetical protein